MAPHRPARAEQMLREKLAEYEDEKQIDGADVLFSDFIVRWLEYVRQKVRVNTYEAYSIAARAHVIPYFKKLDVTLGALLPIHIEQYYWDKMTDGLSRSSVVKHNTVIHGSLQFAVKKLRLLKYNPRRQRRPSSKRGRAVSG